MTRRASVTKDDNLRSHPVTFQRNGFYEHLIKQRDKGKLDITLLSMPTRLSLAEYEKQKRLRESLAADDFKQAAIYGQVSGSAKVKGKVRS